MESKEKGHLENGHLPDTKEDLQTETKEDLQTETKEDLQTETKEDLLTETKEDLPTETNEDLQTELKEDLQTGQPELITPEGQCRNIKLYVFNYAFLLLFYMTQNIYNIGVIRTIERKFGLKSAQSGFIMSINDISHILVVIFIGYFGKKAHKPRFLSISLLFVALAGFLMASPHILFKESDPVPTLNEEQPSYIEHVGGSGVVEVLPIDEVWSNHTHDQQDTKQIVLCGEGEEETCGAAEIERDSGNKAAYFVLLTAQFLAGIGGSGITTLGYSYIDENSPKHESPLYIGIISSVFAFGPIAGLGLSALCLRLPENLGTVPDAKPGDPAWIGCWWLGYVIAASGIILCCIPMWFFPKHIIQRQKTKQEEEKDKMSIKEQLKDFPASLMHLLKNAPFMVFVLMSVLMMYVMSALFANLPRYIEIHFLKPAYVSSFIALSGASAGIIGGFFGGFIMKVRKMGPHGASKILISSACVMIVGIAINMNLGCPQLEVAGQWMDNGQISVETSCNKNCTCSTSRTAYNPVCGEDGLTYFSACHAGCTTSGNGSFIDCGCIVHNNTGSLGTATPGLCASQCGLLLPYCIVFCIFSLFGSIGRAPCTIIQFRIVGDNERAFALSITSFAANLLAFIPAPMLFGAVIDSACILWQKTCSGTGNCLLYDSKKFRLFTHGSALGFKLLTMITLIVIYILVKRMDFPDEDENKNVSKTNLKENGSTEEHEKLTMKELEASV